MCPLQTVRHSANRVTGQHATAAHADMSQGVGFDGFVAPLVAELPVFFVAHPFLGSGLRRYKAFFFFFSLMPVEAPHASVTYVTRQKTASGHASQVELTTTLEQRGVTAGGQVNGSLLR